MRKQKPTQRDELLGNDSVLRENVMSLLKDKNVRRFAKNFGKLMSIRTNAKFLCIYEPRMFNNVSIVVGSSKRNNLKRKKNVNKYSELFVRTFITDEKSGQVIISLISDGVAKNIKNRAKYVMGMINQYNLLQGVTLHGE